MEAIDYIAQENPGAAMKLLEEIRRQTTCLVEFPGMERPGRVRGTRELVVNRTPFILVYRVRSRMERVEIIRILHGAQQWPPMK